MTKGESFLIFNKTVLKSPILSRSPSSCLNQASMCISTRDCWPNGTLHVVAVSSQNERLNNIIDECSVCFRKNVVQSQSNCRKTNSNHVIALAGNLS